MIAYGPPPTVSIYEAQRSERKRLERDLQLAAWCGLRPDEIRPFLRRLREYDAREHVRKLREARAEATRLEREGARDAV